MRNDVCYTSSRHTDPHVLAGCYFWHVQLRTRVTDLHVRVCFNAYRDFVRGLYRLGGLTKKLNIVETIYQLKFRISLAISLKASRKYCWNTRFANFKTRIVYIHAASQINLDSSTYLAMRGNISLLVKLNYILKLFDTPPE